MATAAQPGHHSGPSGAPGAARTVPGPALDVSRARRDTRALAGGAGLLFFNSAGSSLPPSPVVDAQIAYLREEEMRGGYAVSDSSTAQLEDFHAASAQLLGCRAGEVAFVESATRGWTLLFHSLRFSPADRIITSASDYGSNFVSYLQAKERWGAEVVVIPDDPSGQVDLGRLRAAASEPRARLISLNHVPTGGGVVQPAREVGRIAQEFGVPFLLDACQSIGQLDVKVDEVGCDMLTATGRKYLRGPRGTGLMYVRDSFFPQLQPCVLDQEGATLLSETEMRVRQDVRCFEQYECNFAGKVALAIAIRYALGFGLPAIEARVKSLASRLRNTLAALPGVQVTDFGPELCGIVTFTVAGVAAADVKAQLAAAGAACSVSAASGGGSRVWFDRRGLTAVVRASPHYFNTEEEVDALAALVAALPRP